MSSPFQNKFIYSSSTDQFNINRDYTLYPTSTNVEYNNKLNSFENENNLIVYIILEGLKYQDRTLLKNDARRKQQRKENKHLREYKKHNKTN